MAMRAAEAAYRKDGFDISADLFREAADTIDAQAAENKRLREALERLIERANNSDEACYGTLSTTFVRIIARAALQGESHE